MKIFKFESLFLGSKFVIIELSKAKNVNKYKLHNFKDNIDYKPKFKRSTKREWLVSCGSCY